MVCVYSYDVDCSVVIEVLANSVNLPISIGVQSYYICHTVMIGIDRHTINNTVTIHIKENRVVCLAVFKTIVVLTGLAGAGCLREMRC